MLRRDININAEIIWNLLSEQRILSIRQIAEYTHFEGQNIILALGWLEREDKVKLFEKGDTLYVELNQIFSEIYF